jgi:hypothetical protein
MSLEEDLGSELSRTMHDFRSGKKLGWLHRTVLKVRCRIVHQLDQKKTGKDAVKRVSDIFNVTKDRHHNLHRMIHRGLNAGMINKDEYDLALKILGSSETKYNKQPLAEKVAIEALASLVLTETGG